MRFAASPVELSTRPERHLQSASAEDDIPASVSWRDLKDIHSRASSYESVVFETQEGLSPYGRVRFAVAPESQVVAPSNPSHERSQVRFCAEEDKRFALVASSVR